MSGCIPVIHHIITDGYHEAVNFAALGTLIPMALLYLAGALIYAARFPESVWPGKFDIWVSRTSLVIGYGRVSNTPGNLLELFFLLEILDIFCKFAKLPGNFLAEFMCLLS